MHEALPDAARGLPQQDAVNPKGRSMRRPALHNPEGSRVTTEEFERLDEQQAELWIAQRYNRFVDSGFPPDLSLILAVHPEVAVPHCAGAADQPGLDSAA
jgi:hypothetical protein